MSRAGGGGGAVTAALVYVWRPELRPPTCDRGRHDKAYPLPCAALFLARSCLPGKGPVLSSAHRSDFAGLDRGSPEHRRAPRLYNHAPAILKGGAPPQL
eukprot:scaffold25607_cov97-Isochrysis_galbana.AAC.1